MGGRPEVSATAITAVAIRVVADRNSRKAGSVVVIGHIADIARAFDGDPACGRSQRLGNIRIVTATYILALTFNVIG